MCTRTKVSRHPNNAHTNHDSHYTRFSTTLSIGIDAGKEAGVVGIMIGMGVGLVAGGLAYYALKKTAKYSTELSGAHFMKSGSLFVGRLNFGAMDVLDCTQEKSIVLPKSNSRRRESTLVRAAQHER